MVRVTLPKGLISAGINFFPKLIRVGQSSTFIISRPKVDSISGLEISFVNFPISCRTGSTWNLERDKLWKKNKFNYSIIFTSIIYFHFITDIFYLILILLSWVKFSHPCRENGLEFPIFSQAVRAFLCAMDIVHQNAL